MNATITLTNEQAFVWRLCRNGFQPLVFTPDMVLHYVYPVDIRTDTWIDVARDTGSDRFRVMLRVGVPIERQAIHLRFVTRSKDVLKLASAMCLRKPRYYRFPWTLEQFLEAIVSEEALQRQYYATRPWMQKGR